MWRVRARVPRVKAVDYPLEGGVRTIAQPKCHYAYPDFCGRAEKTPQLTDDDTLRLRRLLERFCSGPEKRAHITQRGKVRSVGEDKSPAYELECECRALLGAYRDR